MQHFKGTDDSEGKREDVTGKTEKPNTKYGNSSFTFFPLLPSEAVTVNHILLLPFSYSEQKVNIQYYRNIA